MARKTKEEKRIDFMLEAMKFKPSDGYELPKMMLEQYRDAHMSGEKNPALTEAQIKEQRAKTRVEFLRMMRMPITEARGIQEQFLFNVLEAPWMDENIAEVLDEIEDFRSLGVIYKKILRNAYFTDTCKSNEDIATLCHISDSQLDYRKREAIKFFGIFMWKYMERKETDEMLNAMDVCGENGYKASRRSRF